MFIVVAYDISDDHRRTRLHKALKRFGTPVQESVFEFHLKLAELLRLKQFIHQAIDPQTDEVRFYYLCENCQQRTEATVSSRRSSDPYALIV